MTTFKHPESPYKSDHTASGKAGFTLMNNQVGAVVAQVLAKKDNVKVTYLPSMIRVDGTGTFELDYDEVSEALGYEPGYSTTSASTWSPSRSRQAPRGAGWTSPAPRGYERNVVFARVALSR